MTEPEMWTVACFKSSYVMIEGLANAEGLTHAEIVQRAVRLYLKAKIEKQRETDEH